MKDFCFKKCITIVCTILALFTLLGCGSGNGSSKEIKKITIDSLSGVDNNQLSKDVISYIEQHPKNKEAIINYVLTTKALRENTKFKVQNGNLSTISFTLDKIPFIGGVVYDRIENSLLDNYKNVLTGLIGNYSVAKGVTDWYLKENHITQETHDIFLERHTNNKIDNETYNVLVKIAALLYRELEPIVNDAKFTGPLAPDAFDLVKISLYNKFFDPKYSDKIASAQESIKKIYTALNIDSNLTIKDYWASAIPKYLFPYRLSARFVPNEKSKMYYLNSAPMERRKNLYSLVNGKWESLFTKKEVNIQVNPDIDQKYTVHNRNRISYIYCINESEAYADFNMFDNKTHGHIFITPGVYVNDNGQKEDVLIMYDSYEFLGFNGMETGKGYAQNLSMENMHKAKDVLIKRKNNKNTFEGEYDPKTAFVNSGKNFLMKDKLEASYFPNYENDFVFRLMEMTPNNKIYWQRLYSTINTQWKSLKTGKTIHFNANPANRGKANKQYITSIYCLGKKEMFGSFGFHDKDSTNTLKMIQNFFITPGILIDNNQRRPVYIMYINYKLVQYNQEDNGPKYAENLSIDNIKTAEDVLVRQLD